MPFSALKTDGITRACENSSTNHVQDEELGRDPTVYIMGEEVGDYQGSVSHFHLSKAACEDLLVGNGI